MSTVLVELFEANLAAAAAILIVLGLRKHVHNLLGPGAAYMLWTIVPVAMLAMLMPARTVLVTSSTVAGFSDEIRSAAGPLFIIWMTGAAAMAAVLVQRQRLFLAAAELGQAGPAIVGFFYPRIVTPSDFTQRFSIPEQKLILAHEQVHLERYDARINALVALARCLCWFNPLVHLGAKYLRADQEVSCDAAVVDRRPKARRIYAETLLKTQLAARPLPVGCYWPAGTSHPLTERIAMLTRSPFSHHRRLAAAAAVLALVGGGGFAAWAAQPAREVLADLQEIFVTFEPIAGDEPGILVRLIPVDAPDG